MSALREINPDGFTHWKIYCVNRGAKLCEAFYFGKSIGLFWRTDSKKNGASFLPTSMPHDENGNLDSEWAEAASILIIYGDDETLKKKWAFKNMPDGSMISTSHLGLRSKLRFRYDFSELEAITYQKHVTENKILEEDEIRIEKYTPTGFEKALGIFPVLFWGSVVIGILFFLARH